MQTVSVQLYTAADLWALSHQPEYADKRLELREGVLIEMSPAGGLRGQIASRLDRLIGAFVEAHRLGAVTAAETGYVLCARPDGRETVRAPDVGFVAAGRLPEGMPDGYIPFAPDLAVEVISPNDDAEAVQQKVLDYLCFGTRLVWVVYPRAQRRRPHAGRQRPDARRGRHARRRRGAAGAVHSSARRVFAGG